MHRRINSHNTEETNKKYILTFILILNSQKAAVSISCNDFYASGAKASALDIKTRAYGAEAPITRSWKVFPVQVTVGSLILFYIQASSHIPMSTKI